MSHFEARSSNEEGLLYYELGLYSHQTRGKSASDREDPYYYAFKRHRGDYFRDNLYLTRIYLKDNQFTRTKYDFNQHKRVVDQVIPVLDPAWLEGDKLIFHQPNNSNEVFISEELFQQYCRRYREDRNTAGSIVNDYASSCNQRGEKFKLMIVSGEDYCVDRDEQSNLRRHITSFLYNFKESWVIYFLATVSIDSVPEGNPDSGTMAVHLKVETADICDFRDYSEGDDVVVITQKWWKMFQFPYIRFPEAYVNDGGTINCYGCYSALFVPLDEFDAAKKEFDENPHDEEETEDEDEAVEESDEDDGEDGDNTEYQKETVIDAPDDDHESDHK